MDFEEKKKIADYEEITQIVNQYVIDISSEEKKREYIKTVHELGGHPAQRGRGTTARNFRDGTDQGHYFKLLRSTYKKLKDKEELDEEDKQKLSDYEEIMQVVNQYVVDSEEKKRDYIKTVHELGGHPEQRGRGTSARNFRDGTDQRTYFNILRSTYKKLKDKEELDEEDKQKLIDYGEIMRAYTAVKSGQRFVLSEEAAYASEVASLFDDDGSKQVGGEQVVSKK